MDRLAERYDAGKLYIQRPINEILPPSLLLHLIPPLPPLRYIAISFLLGCLVLLRIWWVLPVRKVQNPQQTGLKRASSDNCTVGVFLGSGGHTTELLQLVSALPTGRYTRRIYLVSSGDRFSLEKANELERKLSASTASSDKPQPSSASKVIRIPRARRVHQSFLTTPFSLARSIAFCIDHVALRPLIRRHANGVLADVILMNGPGTCVPIVAAVYLLRVSVCLNQPMPSYHHLHGLVSISALAQCAADPRTSLAQAGLRRIVCSRQELFAHSQVDTTFRGSLCPAMAARRIQSHTRDEGQSNLQHRLFGLARMTSQQFNHSQTPWQTSRQTSLKIRMSSSDCQDRLSVPASGRSAGSGSSPLSLVLRACRVDRAEIARLSLDSGLSLLLLPFPVPRVSVVAIPIPFGVSSAV